MTPGQRHPNELERALLERLASQYPDARISIPRLHMLSRRFTGAGSFTEFAIEGELSESRRTLSLPVLVTIPGLHEGLGVVAFREGDRLTLETYTFGDEKWDGAFEGFVIA